MATHTTPSYFTCTLSQALRFNRTNHGIETRETSCGTVQCHQDFATIPEFLEFLAREHGERIAIGSAPIGEKRAESLSFAGMRNIYQRAATWLSQRIKRQAETEKTIALLSSSSIVHLITWLALMEAGYQVLLIAPQNTPETISYLVHVSSAIALCIDEKYISLAKDATSNRGAVHLLRIPWLGLSDIERDVFALPRLLPVKENRADLALATAYFFHSTGTTGMPKLIPQTHHGAVGVLPLLQKSWSYDERIEATFTTTPLYHGGIADLFRSWSAAAPLWIFPENHAHITGQQVIRCIREIDDAYESTDQGYCLAYLSCVPFVLQMILEDESALERLKCFKMIGVGGAAMHEPFGNKLVSEAVKLVSRFGSSECGFLLSSKREFTSKSNWEVFRPNTDINLFKEVGEDGLWELVVPLEWPIVSTAKHAARPFYTKDLFRKDDDGWKYMGRSDAQITLGTGKKFDPHKIESGLKDNMEIEEAIIVGEGKSKPCLLIFTSESNERQCSSSQKERIRELVAEVNVKNPPHTRVKKDMIMILPFNETQRLRKTVKGAVVRRHAIREFQIEIDALYASSSDISQGPTDSGTVKEIVARIVKNQLTLDNKDFANDSSFLEYGVDSSGCISIRSQLHLTFFSSKHSSEVPLSRIYESDTVDKLAEWLENTLKGGKADSDEMRNTQLTEVKSLTHQLLNYKSGQMSTSTSQKLLSTEKVVIITGATGFLGSHILHELLKREDITKIHVLVREDRGKPAVEHQQAAVSRLYDSLFRKRLPSVENQRRINIHPVRFNDSKLGLAKTKYEEIANPATHLIHAAWDVNFNLPLKAFRPQLEAMIHLSNLLQRSRYCGRFVFCSSTAVSNCSSKPDGNISADQVPETGYGQSKLVAETLLMPHSAFETIILRVGQLCGDTEHGIWSAREAWPLMIDASFNVVPHVRTGKEDGASGALLPNLAIATQPDIDWLPVDIAAKQVVSHAFSHTKAEARVELVANTTSKIPWGVFQDDVKKLAEQYWGVEINFISPLAWLDLLEEAKQHRSQSLIPLWRKNWRSTTTPSVDKCPSLLDGNENCKSEKFDVLSKEAIWKMITWILKRS